MKHPTTMEEREEMIRKSEAINWPTTTVVQDADTGETWEEMSIDNIAMGAAMYDDAVAAVKRDPVYQAYFGVMALSVLARRAKDRVVKYIRGE